MAEKTMPITGGCLCGAVRFEATEPPSFVAYCHCRMCQKACGQPYTITVGFAGAQKGALLFTKGKPKYYKSSAWLERAFCANCGSPLGARDAEGHSVMAGTLDHPEEWPPNEHVGIESQVPWLVIHDDLPRTRTDESPDFIAAKAALDQDGE